MISYYSTNNISEKVNFQTALLKGLASNYGLYMIARGDIPKLSKNQILAMRGKSYAEIAFEVLNPFLKGEMPEKDLKSLLGDAYDMKKIPTRVEKVTGKTYIMWLTDGPTYSFKDYAARFFGRALNYSLEKNRQKRTVLVATSGDTGGAVADALLGLKSVDCIVFYPKGSISDRQKRQMTTLQNNVYAFEVNGDFDVCQALAKKILGNKELAREIFGDEERFTSANSISIGRLLPQAVYPFYAYSQVKEDGKMIASIPSGNFGDMMGTVIAREMGLPIERIVIGLNENTEVYEFLKDGKFVVRSTIASPSSAMNVSNPSNLSRLFEIYGGHVFDKRDETGIIIEEGVIDKMPDIEKMRTDFACFTVTSKEHYAAIREVYEKYGIILDPHGAVAWKALDEYLKGKHDKFAIVYETADPGKFPADVKKAIGIEPKVPKGIAKQASLEERIFSIESEPDKELDARGKQKLKLSKAQYKEAVLKIKGIYR